MAHIEYITYISYNHSIPSITRNGKSASWHLVDDIDDEKGDIGDEKGDVSDDDNLAWCW